MFETSRNRPQPSARQCVQPAPFGWPLRNSPAGQTRRRRLVVARRVPIPRTAHGARRSRLLTRTDARHPCKATDSRSANSSELRWSPSDRRLSRRPADSRSRRPEETPRPDGRGGTPRAVARRAKWLRDALAVTQTWWSRRRGSLRPLHWQWQRAFRGLPKHSREPDL